MKMRSQTFTFFIFLHFPPLHYAKCSYALLWTNNLLNYIYKIKVTHSK